MASPASAPSLSDLPTELHGAVIEGLWFIDALALGLTNHHFSSIWQQYVTNTVSMPHYTPAASLAKCPRLKQLSVVDDHGLLPYHFAAWRALTLLVLGENRDGLAKLPSTLPLIKELWICQWPWSRAPRSGGIVSSSDIAARFPRLDALLIHYNGGEYCWQPLEAFSTVRRLELIGDTRLVQLAELAKLPNLRELVLHGTGHYDAAALEPLRDQLTYLEWEWSPYYGSRVVQRKSLADLREDLNVMAIVAENERIAREARELERAIRLSKWQAERDAERRARDAERDAARRALATQLSSMEAERVARAAARHQADEDMFYDLFG